MKRIINKIGWPVLFNFLGYIFCLFFFLLSGSEDIILGILLIAATEISFIVAFILSIRYVYLSKKKHIKLEKSMKLFQQGIWGFLLFVPWVMITLFFWIVMK